MSRLPPPTSTRTALGCRSCRRFQTLSNSGRPLYDTSRPVYVTIVASSGRPRRSRSVRFSELETPRNLAMSTQLGITRMDDAATPQASSSSRMSEERATKESAFRKSRLRRARISLKRKKEGFRPSRLSPTA